MPIFPIIIVLIVACLAWWLIDLIPIPGGPPQIKLILRIPGLGLSYGNG